MIATVAVVVVDSESFDSLLDSEVLTSVCNYCDFLLDSEFFNMDSLVVDSDSFDFLLEWEFFSACLHDSNCCGCCC